MKRTMILVTICCAAGCGSPQADLARVTVAGLTPHSDFSSTGLFDFTVVPFDVDGRARIDAHLAFEVDVSAPSGTSVEQRGSSMRTVDPAESLITAINMDASGSMRSNDPAKLRVEAAKQFIDALDDNDLVAVMDFGSREALPFEWSRLLSDFTSDKEAAKAAAENVESFGHTPLYESIDEVLAYFHSAHPAGNRALLVLGDGRPVNDRGTGSVETSCARAVATGIPINTIGFGPAADTKPSHNDEAVKVLRDLAQCSGGAYSSAAEASDLSARFAAQATATTNGSVTMTVQFSPVPPSGATVEGTLRVGGTVEVAFEFVAP